MKLLNILRSIYIYILWSCTVAALWYPRSCVAAQLRLQSHSPPSVLRVGVVYPGGFYVPLLGIEIIDGGSFGIISPPNRCRWRSDISKWRDRYWIQLSIDWDIKEKTNRRWCWSNRLHSQCRGWLGIHNHWFWFGAQLITSPPSSVCCDGHL